MDPIEFHGSLVTADDGRIIIALIGDGAIVQILTCSPVAAEGLVRQLTRVTIRDGTGDE